MPMSDAVDEFTHPDLLVEPRWLADHLDDPAIVVVDVTARLSGDLVNHAESRVYRSSHIPSSVFLDVGSAKGQLSHPAAELPWTWPPVDRFEAAMRAVGVNDGSRVVIAARTPRSGIDSGTMWCTRAWWTMHHMGVDAAILRGGLERWEAEGLPLTGEPSPVTPGGFTATGDGATGRATRNDVLAAIGAGSATCLVDALPAADYAGDGNAYGPRAGHITGAINVPGRSLVDAETALFPPPAELHRRLDAAGLLDRDDVITYCGGAIAATIPAFALALFGRADHVRVYDGSLMEWSADPLLPMSTSEGPSA